MPLEAASPKESFERCFRGMVAASNSTAAAVASGSPQNAHDRDAPELSRPHWGQIMGPGSSREDVWFSLTLSL